jgi:hypothetical protein
MSFNLYPPLKLYYTIVHPNISLNFCVNSIDTIINPYVLVIFEFSPLASL